MLKVYIIKDDQMDQDNRLAQLGQITSQALGTVSITLAGQVDLLNENIAIMSITDHILHK